MSASRRAYDADSVTASEARQSTVVRYGLRLCDGADSVTAIATSLRSSQ
jgi:hypothetical protein